MNDNHDLIDDERDMLAWWGGLSDRDREFSIGIGLTTPRLAWAFHKFYRASEQGLPTEAALKRAYLELLKAEGDGASKDLARPLEFGRSGAPEEDSMAEAPHGRMIDAHYSQEEMDILLEIAIEYRDNFDRYSGSHMKGADKKTFTSMANRFIDAYAMASRPRPDRPTQKKGWIRVQKIGDRYRVQAEADFAQLTAMAMEPALTEHPARKKLLGESSLNSGPANHHLRGQPPPVQGRH